MMHCLLKVPKTLFLTAFEQMLDVLTKFTLERWNSMVDYTIGADKSRFHR